MAIIYETKEDFERDKLKDQVKDVNLKAEKQSSWGLAAIVGATIVDQFNTKKTKGLWMTSLALSAVGFVEIIKSLFTTGKAHDLEMKHERMGPQVSVIPANASIPVLDDSCPVCPHHKHDHKHMDKIQPTSLLEQAEKSAVEIVR